MTADPTTNKQPYEELTSARGPTAPARDKSPEAQYKPTPGDSNNRTDAAAPSGPVNIPVKGQAPAAGPDNAATEASSATGRGRADASSQPQD